MTVPSDQGAPSAACPKCGRARDAGAETCARCGLMFARWSPEQAAEVVQLDATGEKLWADLRASWNDEALHDAFVKHCSVSGRLPAAGRLYRALLDREPGNALATRMQARIVGMATALLTPTQPRGPAVSRRGWFLWVLIIGALAGVLGSLLYRAWS
jgi:hypothetical protein